MHPEGLTCTSRWCELCGRRLGGQCPSRGPWDSHLGKYISDRFSIGTMPETLTRSSLHRLSLTAPGIFTTIAFDCGSLDSHTLSRCCEFVSSSRTEGSRGTAKYSVSSDVP